MRTIAEYVEQWYKENLAVYSPNCLDFSFRSFKPDDLLLGGASISIATETVLANMTLWNKGCMDVFGVDKLSSKDFTLREGQLGTDQDVRSLLSHYMQQILKQA